MVEHEPLKIASDELDLILGDPDFWRDEQKKTIEFCEAADKRLQQLEITVIL